MAARATIDAINATDASVMSRGREVLIIPRPYTREGGQSRDHCGCAASHTRAHASALALRQDGHDHVPATTAAPRVRATGAPAHAWLSSRALLPLHPDPCPAKTRADLQWERLLAAVAARCAGPLGRDLALTVPFATTREDARDRLAQAQEATRLLDEGRPLPVGEVPDVRDAIERARVGGVLAPEELRAVGRMLGTARALRRFLASRKAEVPSLFEACATDPTLDALADEIGGSFEVDGTLSDRASPRLRELRGEWHSARQRMLARMNDLMDRYASVVQDRFVTEREGRWVLPVRSDAHERFPGIVHSTSSSGATLFVEPRAVVPMGNRLKVLEAEVRREEEAAYARLTALIADALPSVDAAADALAHADLRAAIARLARDITLRFPEIVDEPRIDLRGARHPLLALETEHVVPSDLAIEGGRAIVVSGPNAGGKTVTLTTLGLAALMVRFGMPVACADGSTVGLFDVVLTDVGDDQSLQKNLSTFSAHVTNLAEVLSETTRGALVLLDELAGGTDPREGEALAAAVLDSLCARGGAVAVTTHYEGLKVQAAADTRFQNASVGFDLATMTPTFRLAVGVPGGSSALAVARRFGIPGPVVERAERFLAREDKSFEQVIKRLDDERAALELARAAADKVREEARETRDRFDAELQAIKERERRTLSDEATELLDRVRRAREELRAAQARLRSKKLDAAQVREAERAIDRVAGEVAVGGPLERALGKAGGASAENERAPVTAARKGERVWVERLRAEAEVVEVIGSGSVRIAAGPLKMTVPLTELRVAIDERPAPAPATKRSAPRALPSENPIQTRANTCDLRGLRVDDGVAMANSFLDRALNEGQDVVFLLHGHGTGALREALRKELAGSRYVSRTRGGATDEGGEAVTVVWLA
jgi:DNA mismatch repair protein MutS2